MVNNNKAFFAVSAGLLGVLLSASNVLALDSSVRDSIMEKKLSCFSKNASQKNIDWDDVCVTSDKKEKGRYGDDLDDSSSLDEMIKRHEQMADEMLNDPVLPDDTPEKTVDDVVEEIKQDPEAKRTVDDFVAEQKIYENSDAASNKKETYQLAQAEDTAGEASEDVAKKSYNPALTHSANSFQRGNEDLSSSEFGFEYNHFRYEEDIFDLVDKGNLFGIYGGYTFRPGRSQNSLADILDVYKIEGRFNYGKVDYKSAPSGTIDDITDWTYEVRLLAGKDFVMGDNMRVTPLIGLGYRYLNDDTGGKRSSTGALGYEREANYFYIPIGVEFAARVAENWTIIPHIEYDVFIQGRQESHLSDVSSGLPDLSNKQHDGFGARGSIKLIREFEKFSLVVEPYIRYWDIEDSDTSTAAGTGFIITGLEPANSSTEYGVRLGAMF